MSTVVIEPSAVLGSVAAALAEPNGLSPALAELVSGLGLRGVALRTAAGDLLATGGDVLRVSTDPVLELPVPVRNGAAAVLTVTGARPSHLPALRAAASVLGLALAPVGCAALLDAAEAERDHLADTLHDGAVQSLVVAKLLADAAVRGGDPGAARDAVQSAVGDLRRALWQIRPRGGSGLVAALEQLSEQRAQADLPAIAVVAAADLSGTAGALAYRLVQAVEPARVAIRREDDHVTVDVTDGGALPTPELWAARARSLGGDLYASAGRVRLVLPLTTTARTAT